MAITITLPNSLGGIVGPTETIDGPLSSLYQSEYDIATLHYPRNLGASNRGHSVLFTIKKVKEVTIEEGLNSVYNMGYTDVMSGEDPISGLPTYDRVNIFDSWSNFSTAVRTAANEAIDTGQSFVNNSFSFNMENIRSVGRQVDSFKNSALKQNTEIVSHVELYMPETLNFTYNAQYNSLSLIEAAASVPLVGKLASGINSIMENKAAKLILNRAGYVFNPQQQLLFEGIDFRTYQMAFTFSPVSREEAKMVNKIIKEFRRYAAPTIVREAAGMFFVPPAIFDIQFRFNGQENGNLNKIEQSVITDIDVNYAPNGWAAHGDGSPVQTTMTLSFKEIALIDRAKIEEGF
jgi:hypothetical protein